MNYPLSLRALMASLLLLLSASSSGSEAAASEQSSAGPLLKIILELDGFPHAEQVQYSSETVLDYEVGLGAMQKQMGDWQFKRSERLDADVLRYTWQIIDGFTSSELYDNLLKQVEQLPQSERLFICEARACGNGAQWANRVFRQRLLYGRADAQRYAVYRVNTEPGYWLLAYASARSADRQYLHVELLRLAPQLEE
ncbi:DUF4892 domain-containing protein [Parahaliea sp. F7430]|uniref:DUF4892 domain-containing protein n=1 Tax=Sediminihaliea albiluteola TaxID=2758564 RepID=A0A7W2TUX5_9GAMM|nr:DUF4892 domain-containing protein [Sediminihaliea albiluteola]MBA6412403.1 DUF4892 domain-containing protein [Sediminihaliea albiluteola]